MHSDLIHTEDRDFHDRRVSVVAFIARIFDYLFGILYGLLLVRFTLELFEARPGAGFFQLVAGLTDGFYAPFKGLFATTMFAGGRVVWSLLVAVLAYMLLHAVIRGALHLIARA